MLSFRTTGSPPPPTAGSRSSQCILELRRRERRHDIIEELRKTYKITEVIDYSSLRGAQGCLSLKARGSLVLDHVNRIAYVSLSNRSNPKVIRRFADDFGYEAVTFTSVGSDGQPIYHTNVMMCVGSEFADCWSRDDSK